MRKYILGIICAISFVACGQYDYPRNKEISNKDGAIVDTVGGYLLKEITFDGTTHTLEWNNDLLSQLNDYYLETMEPVLFNFYLKRGVYRLVIHEDDDEPLILSFNKGKDNAWIVSKRIKNNGLIEADSTSLSSPPLEVNFDIFSKELTKEQVHTFDSIFQKIDFFSLPNDQVSNSSNNYLFMEVHQKDKYWNVYRSLDDSSLKEIHVYMRSIARL